MALYNERTEALKYSMEAKMKKLMTALVLAFALLLAGCGSAPGSVSPSPSQATPPSPKASVEPSVPAGAEELSVAGYFPFKTDVHMTYRGTGNEYAAFETWVEYVGDNAVQIRKNTGGTILAMVYVIEDGALKLVFSQEETYYRYDFTAERTRSEVMIMEPITVGTTWKLDDGTTRAITATDADVTVPYGTFKALEVTTERDDSVTKFYYVQDMGLVKTEFTTKGTSPMIVTSDLEKYEEGSPLSENARFYYPDFSGEGLKYINQSVEYNTGDSFLAKLEKAFKNPPSGLGPVMSDGAAIRSIMYDRSTGVVTVDFNKTFVTEMNAGTSYEGMILSSIANTLGSYFQTDKIQITLEGGPYESGHFLFNTGNYLPFNPEDAVEHTP